MYLLRRTRRSTGTCCRCCSGGMEEGTILNRRHASRDVPKKTLMNIKLRRADRVRAGGETLPRKKAAPVCEGQEQDGNPKNHAPAADVPGKE